MSGAAVLVGDGKEPDASKPFGERSCRIKVEAVAMDMLPAFQEAARTHLRGAAIVFDHSCALRLLNDKLSEFASRGAKREAADVRHKRVVEGTRWLLLQNLKDHKPERDERRRLEALALNRPLATA